MRLTHIRFDRPQGEISDDHQPPRFHRWRRRRIAVANLPARAAGRDQDAAAQKLLAEFAEELLVDYPESATALGIDKGARAALKAKLSDRSAAGQDAIAQRVAKRLERMKAIDTSTTQRGERASMWMSCAQRTSLRPRVSSFPYGDVALLNPSWSWRNAPYVVAQNTGAFLEIPSMLDEQHTVETREDADAYLARLEAYAGQLDGETGRLQSAAAQGVIAPDFLLDKTLQADQDRARREHRGLVARDLAGEADEGHAGRFREQGSEDCGRQDCAGARSPDRRARSASPARDERCGRVEASAGR